MLSSSTIRMSNQTISTGGVFFQNLPQDLILGDDAAQRRLFREYGSVFVARGGVLAPNKVVFADEEDVAQFQSRLEIAQCQIGEFLLELQSRAMDGLQRAIVSARNEGLSITPRGADSARRNYSDTIELWQSRVGPALAHWVEKERMTQEHADAIRELPPSEQIPEVFELEEEGIYFAKDLSKSIIYSVAPPGASQHLSLLAFDVAEFDNERVRELLAKHYWYQTVISDLPHFTFLGVEESELAGLGLRLVENSGRNFWLPDV
ncbi:MAG: hypothetical protein ABI646_03380 [Acidobacteriota bacterium]